MISNDSISNPYSVKIELHAHTVRALLMNKKTTLIWTICALLAIAPLYAKTQQPGTVIFNVSQPPVAVAPTQPVTLFGCNNTIINTDVSWNTENQAVKIPYGPHQSKTGKHYFISKYYIASPEVVSKTGDNPIPYLGLVIPDHFIFYGDKPAQLIQLNYQLFNPTDLAEIPTDFNYQYHGQSCHSQKVNFIPISTQCKNLAWRNGALGGAGIGLLSQHPKSTAFIPMLKKNETPLECTVTILDDIMLDFEVFFASKAGKSKSINLTTWYKQSEPLKLICIPRSATDVPPGCR